MIKIAVCDDDLSTLEKMQTLLEQYRVKRNQEIMCRTFRSPFELLEETESRVRFDVCFLDILMPGENGIHAARELRRHDNVVKIIFLTSSAEFAVDSYSVGACSYQMKPLNADRLFPLMDHVIEACGRERWEGIVVRGKNCITRIPLDKLEYCEVIGRQLRFSLSDKSVLVGSGGMDRLWSELAQYGDFIRPHRSFLINMRYIRNISGRTITMENQDEIPIPHGKCVRVREQYLAYAFDKKQVFVL